MGGVGAILGKNFNVWQHALKKMQEGGRGSGQHQVRTLLLGNTFVWSCINNLWYEHVVEKLDLLVDMAFGSAIVCSFSSLLCASAASDSGSICVFSQDCFVGHWGSRQTFRRAPRLFQKNLCCLHLSFWDGGWHMKDENSISGNAHEQNVSARELNLLVRMRSNC